MNGLAAAAGVYVISLVLEDTLRTAIAEVAFDQMVQSCIYQSVVYFTLAFVGSFIARRNFVVAITLVASVYILVRVNNYLEDFVSAGDRPSDVELLIESAPLILVSIISIIVGALAGQRLARSSSANDSDARYASRKKVLLLSMLGLCVIAPQAYSAYWFGEAQNETRKALNSIKSGTIPENVEPFTSVLVDKTEDVNRLMDTYSDEFEVQAVHKFGAGFHSYEVQIFSGDEDPYHAFASYIGDEWRIDCCSQW